MKYVVAVLLVALAPSIAQAQGRPSTTTMSCGAVQELVRSRQAVVLGTGGDTFDRIVSNEGQCYGDQVLYPVTAPTTDNRQCAIGWRCFERPSNDR